MLGTTRLTMVLGAAPDNTSDDAVLKSYARALADVGLSVLFITPGTKIPADYRSAPAKKKDLAAGLDKAGLHLATSDRATLARYVEAGRKKHGPLAPLNLAIHAGRSRVVVIDADTPTEVDAWRSWWAEATGEDMAGVPPTVTTPGAQDDDGAWKHHGGGHWYLRLPEGYTVPEGTPAKVKVKHGGGEFTAYVGDAYVLIPPSTRPEGRYEMTGTDYPAPQALLDALVAREKPAKKERGRTPTPLPVARERVAPAVEAEGQVSLEDWLESTPWAEVLPGWMPTGGADTCGCPQWTAPGVHAEPKSAVTHEACGDHTDGGRLQVWTDNPQTDTPMDGEVAADRRTFSKLQALALLAHDGDVLEAMDAQGIDRSTAPSGGGLLEVGKGKTREKAEDLAKWFNDNFTDRDGVEAVTPPSPLIDGWLDMDTTAALIGEPGSLKSFHIIDMACCIATGREFHGAAVAQAPVVIAVGEGLAGMRQRLHAWETTHNGGQRAQGVHVFRTPFPLHEESSARVAYFARRLAALGVKFVVFDTLARYAVGANESSSQDMGVAVGNLDTIREATGGCAMVVHHTTRGTTHGRGSTALLGAWNTELLATKTWSKDGGMRAALAGTKAKDGEEHEEVQILPQVVDVDLGDDRPRTSLALVHETDAGYTPPGGFHRPGGGCAQKAKPPPANEVVTEIVHEYGGGFVAWEEIRDRCLEDHRLFIGGDDRPLKDRRKSLLNTRRRLADEKGWLENNPAATDEWRATDRAITALGLSAREGE